MLNVSDGTFEGWSSGTEAWEPVVLSGGDLIALQLVHQKNHEGRRWAVYRDPLGRWFRQTVGPARG